MKLYRQPDGVYRDEKGLGWQPVNHHENVETGIYLCKVGKGISPYCKNWLIGAITLDPVHIAKGGTGSRPASPAGTGARTPDQSPMPPPLISPGKQAVENVMKAVTKSKTGVRILILMQSSYQSSKFRDNVILRDGGCVIYRTRPDRCNASHIIPASLVKVILF